MTIELLLILLTFILLYINYTLHFINIISYFIALILYYSNLRKSIIEYNLKKVFPNITKKRMNYIRFKSGKLFVLNFLTVLNQYFFDDSFLIKYYNIKFFNLPNKSFISLLHIGIFYDYYSLNKIYKNSSFIIIRKYIDLNPKNKKIKIIDRRNINFEEMNKFYVIATPIDQKYGGRIEVQFLNQKVKFHKSLVNYSILNKRDIYLYYVLFDEKNIKLNFNCTKINTNNRNLKEIVQDIAHKMTVIIKKHPEQYLWAHNRFNFKKK